MERTKQEFSYADSKSWHQFLLQLSEVLRFPNAGCLSELLWYQCLKFCSKALYISHLTIMTFGCKDQLLGVSENCSPAHWGNTPQICPKQLQLVSLPSFWQEENWQKSFKRRCMNLISSIKFVSAFWNIWYFDHRSSAVCWQKLLQTLQWAHLNDMQAHPQRIHHISCNSRLPRWGRHLVRHLDC